MNLLEDYSSVINILTTFKYLLLVHYSGVLFDSFVNARIKAVEKPIKPKTDEHAYMSGVENIGMFYLYLRKP